METKNIIKQILSSATAVAGGEQDALKAYIELKAIESAMDTAFDTIKDDVLSECDKYDPRELGERGISVRAGTGRWHYEECPEWTELEKQRKELEKELQGRASTTKELVDAETGELLAKPYRTFSARSVVVDKRTFATFF